MTYDAFFLPRHAAYKLTPLPDDFAWNTPKRRLPGRERPDSRGFRHFFVYIAHFPQKSKLYGEINWYIRHSGGLILGQVVNVPTSFKWWAGDSAKKARQISRRSPDWGRNTAPCLPPLPRPWSRPVGSSWW